MDKSYKDPDSMHSSQPANNHQAKKTPMKMNEHRDGLTFLILGSIVLVLVGTVLSLTSTVDMIDYRAMYFPARCLTHNCDPYNESAVLNLAKLENGVRQSDNAHSDNHFARYLYLPTAFTFTTPFAALPWRLSRLIWMDLIGAGFVMAGFLMWNVGKDYSPLLAGDLAGFFLADNELLMVVGNIAGIAIILCIVGSWCIIRDRFVPVGILCFASSLIIKPHDSGLVWLYFLLAGGLFRKRALEVLGVTVVLSLPGMIWTSIVSPNWIHELSANLAIDSLRGERSDPAIASLG